MGNPVEKLKKIIMIMGITGVVYVGLKYLLPLVVPFLLAYATALWLRPSVRFLERKLNIVIGGRKRSVPGPLIGTIELLLVLLALGTLFFFGGRKLFSQIHLLATRLPDWLAHMDRLLTDFCLQMETILGFKDGYLVTVVGDMVEELGLLARQSTMPALMNNSMVVLGWIAGSLVFFVIYFVSVILCLQEMEEIRERRSRSAFHREFSLLSRRLVNAGNAWLKTQLIIMFITAVLCVAGFFLIGNPYSIVLGVGVGILDALPLFGTGVLLIPWGMILLIEKEWWKATVLLGLYGICYLIRQVLEAKMMGNRMGLSPLETLMSMYVGLQLFGIAGFLLGPIGLLIIEDLIQLYSERNLQQKTVETTTGEK